MSFRHRVFPLVEGAEIAYVYCLLEFARSEIALCLLSMFLFLSINHIAAFPGQHWSPPYGMTTLR